ncbi:MAG TPA: HAD family hydrolase [Spirochaetia bacterium]|nr:HAD family hydrolase [Spirochaetia bacterium]
MRVYYIPKDSRGLVFDIDSTLYRNDAYTAAMEEGIVRRFASERRISFDEALRMVNEYRRNFAEQNGGRKPSLGNTYLALGVPIAISARWREETIDPKRFLSKDRRLRETLSCIAQRFRFIAVTNNPTSIGRETLRALGVDAFFPFVIGLDVSGVSKPHERPFLLASEALGLPLHSLVSIGDRYEVDLEVPLSLGMGAILVESMEDVYSLPSVLCGRGEYH